MRRFDFWLTKRIYILPFSLVLAVAVWFNSPGKRTDACPSSAPDRDRIGQSVPLINEWGGATDREPRVRRGRRAQHCLSSVSNAVPSVSGWNSLCEHVAPLSQFTYTQCRHNTLSQNQNSETSSVSDSVAKQKQCCYPLKYAVRDRDLVIKMCWSLISALRSRVLEKVVTVRYTLELFDSRITSPTTGLMQPSTAAVLPPPNTQDNMDLQAMQSMDWLFKKERIYLLAQFWQQVCYIYIHSFIKQPGSHKHRNFLK